MLADPALYPEFYRDVPIKRLLAWLTDVLLVALLTAIAVPFTAFIGLFFLPALYVTIDFVYRVITLATGSSTWGMRMFAIELRDAEGQSFNLGQALMHTIGYYVSWAVTPLQLVSVIFMAASARRQSLTDMFMGSAAMNRRALT